MSTNNVQTIRKIFADARGQLIGRFGSIIGPSVLVSLISTTSLLIPLVVFVITRFNVIPLIISWIAVLFLGILSTGLSRAYLKIARTSETVKINDIFTLGGINIDKILILRLFPLSVEIIIAILFFVLKRVMFGSIHLIGALYGLVFLESLILFAYDFFLLFVNFILIDNPDMPVGEIVRKSCELLKGRRLTYLLMSLCFIPLSFLASYACNVGNFWLQPWMGVVIANFYLDAIGEEPLTPEREQKRAAEQANTGTGEWS
jgi:hypothetical protein